jgi:hypothetical protein
MAESRRKKDDSGAAVSHYRWFQEHSKFFFCIGRFLIIRRKEFTEKLLGTWRHWCELPELKNADDRSKQVHGIGYAALFATSALLESNDAEDLREFKRFLIGHAMRAVEDVRSEVYINQVWHAIVNAFKVHAFGKTRSEFERFFKISSEVLPHPPDAPAQGAWVSYKLFIDYSGVIEILKRHLRSNGEQLPLTRTDVRDQLEKSPYWLRPKGKKLNQRFGSGTAPKQCWGFLVDKHPMGYQAVTDQELAESKNDHTRQDWADPRKGELFEIIEALEDQPHHPGPVEG